MLSITYWNVQKNCFRQCVKVRILKLSVSTAQLITEHHNLMIQLFRKFLREVCNTWGKPSAAGN